MPASPQRFHEYKIFRDGVFLGILQNVGSQFGYSQNISSVGAQLTITVNQSADISELPPDPILDETGDPILDETGDVIYDEQAAEVVGDSNDNILIRNDNDIEVWQYDDNHINGILVYSGYISKWKGRWGTHDDIIVTCLNHSQDLVSYTTPGSTIDTIDQSQTSYDDVNGGWGMFTSTGLPQWPGQTFKTGSGVTNLSRIKVRMGSYIDQTVRIEIYNNPNEAIPGSGIAPIATATVFVPGGPGDADTNSNFYTFIFSAAVDLNSLQTYFFVLKPLTVITSTSDTSWAASANTDPYANGNGYLIRGGASPVRDAIAAGGGPDDFYFVTYYTNNSTGITYTNQDPSTILNTIIDYYISYGGSIDKPVGGYSPTGILVPEITFKLNSILEAIQKIVALAPYDWYWYVDPATEILYFKETSTTIQHRFIKGTHLNDVIIEATKENIVNVVYFSGGKVGVDNLFVLVSDAQSLTVNRRGLARLSDNTVTDTSVAQLIAQNYIDQHSEQTYTTTITIPYTLYDETTVSPGDVVAIMGFGTFVDTLSLQVVNKSPGDESFTLTLGVLLPRQTALATQLRQELTALQTIDNPDSPS